MTDKLFGAALNGLNVYIDNYLCGTLSNGVNGAWNNVNCPGTGVTGS